MTELLRLKQGLLLLLCHRHVSAVTEDESGRFVMSGNGNGLFVANGEGVEAKQKMGKAGSSFGLGVVAPSCSASSTDRDSFAPMPPPTNNSRSTSNPQ